MVTSEVEEKNCAEYIYLKKSSRRAGQKTKKRTERSSRLAGENTQKKGKNQKEKKTKWKPERSSPLA